MEINNTTQRRVTTLKKQLQPNTSLSTKISIKKTSSHIRPRSGEDIVIVSPCRTAMCRGFRGKFKDLTPDELLTPVFKEVLKRSKIDPKLIGDIIIGKVLGVSLRGANQVRMASLMAGIPNTVPCQTVNRQCSSGLQALAMAASNIRAGHYDIAIAGGVESMSKEYKEAQASWKGKLNPKVMQHPVAKGCYLPMLVTSENVAKKYVVTREEQDKIAFESQRRAAKAQQEGKFDDEIVPVPCTVTDKEGNRHNVIVNKDGGVRKNTTLEGLGKLRTVMKEGSTTAGNASQISDGAAAMLVMKRKTANKLGLPIEGIYHSISVVGVPPYIMGVGPAYAIPKLLSKTGLGTNDIDLYELNEAFASQFIFCMKKLNLDKNKVNVNGGAIALGHPLGCTGARMVSTILNELKRRNGKYGVISMCIGTGMGAAALLERE